MRDAVFDTSDNRLLTALPPQDCERLRSCLERVDLVAGQVLHQARQAPRYAYFPIGAVVSLQVQSEDGTCDEVAIVGREGMVGVSAFTGSGSSVLRSVVQSPGRALRLSSERIRAELGASSAMLRLLLIYAETQELQVAQGVVCSRHHTIEQRLALRLLVAVDRQQSDRPLAMTHEQLSGWLGVRRGSVTEEALKLQKADLIAYSRGRITILDRVGLEHRACECLSFVTTGWRRLLAPATAPAQPPCREGRSHLPGEQRRGVLGAATG